MLQSKVVFAEGLAVNVTDLPEQKVAAAPFVTDTVGVGKEVTVTEAGAEAHKFVCVAVTVYVPAVETDVVGVVAPLLQSKVVFAEELAVSVTAPPEQKVAAAPFVTDIVGVGKEVTVTEAGAEAHKFVCVAVTV